MSFNPFMPRIFSFQILLGVFLTSMAAADPDLDNPYYQERPTWRNLQETCLDDLNKHWLDIKGARCYLNPYSKDTGLEEALHTELEHAIKAYHNIEKKDERLFDSRIHALKSIAKLSAAVMRDLSIDNPNRIPLEHLTTRANLKADYIQKLPGIRQEAENRARNTPKNQGNTVVNMKHLNDMLTDIDPAKRVNHQSKRSTGLSQSPLFHKWAYYVGKEPETTPDYFIWLEDHLYASELVPNLRHTFLSKGAKKVIFKGDGLAYNGIFREHGSKSIIDGRYIYNINEEGDLYVLPDKIHPKEVNFKAPGLFTSTQQGNETLEPDCWLNHDNLLGGENLLCAGTLYFKEGRISHIDTDSGHYMPKMLLHLRPALAKLIEKYPNAIAPETMIGNHDRKILMPYRTFLTAMEQDISEGNERPLKYENFMLQMGQNLRFIPKD